MIERGYRPTINSYISRMVCAQGNFSKYTIVTHQKSRSRLICISKKLYWCLYCSNNKSSLLQLPKLLVRSNYSYIVAVELWHGSWMWHLIFVWTELRFRRTCIARFPAAGFRTGTLLVILRWSPVKSSYVVYMGTYPAPMTHSWPPYDGEWPTSSPWTSNVREDPNEILRNWEGRAISKQRIN